MHKKDFKALLKSKSIPFKAGSFLFDIYGNDLPADTFDGVTILPAQTTFYTEGNVLLKDLQISSTGLQFRNSGSVSLPSLVHIKHQVTFLNKGNVLLPALTVVEPWVGFYNSGDIHLDKLTSLPVNGKFSEKIKNIYIGFHALDGSVYDFGNNKTIFLTSHELSGLASNIYNTPFDKSYSTKQALLFAAKGIPVNLFGKYCFVEHTNRIGRIIGIKGTRIVVQLANNKQAYLSLASIDTLPILDFVIQPAVSEQ